MKHNNVNSNETSSLNESTFPLGYFAENHLVPTASEKIGRNKAFADFENNWKQLIDDSSKQSSEGYYDSEFDSEAGN